MTFAGSLSPLCGLSVTVTVTSNIFRASNISKSCLRLILIHKKERNVKLYHGLICSLERKKSYGFRYRLSNLLLIEFQMCSFHPIHQLVPWKTLTFLSWKTTDDGVTLWSDCLLTCTLCMLSCSAASRLGDTSSIGERMASLLPRPESLQPPLQPPPRSLSPPLVSLPCRCC